MPTEEEIKEQVTKALDGEGAEPATANTPEDAASPEVKTEAEEKPTEGKPIEEKPINAEKLQEQINNLNVALKEARAEAKGKVDQTKVAELEQKLAEREDFINRLQTAFTPEKEEAEIEEEKKFLTAEEAEALWQQKAEEEKQKTFKEKQAETIKNEIATLEKEWDGNNGKPKYKDEEVLKWQQENQKLYLSPAEAFTQMKKNEIIDWEVKQRLAGKKPVEDVERPGVSPDEHTPAETKPQTEEELRRAVEEAMNSANAEM